MAKRRTHQSRRRRTVVRRYDGYGLLGLPSPTTLLGLGLGLAGVIWYFRSRVIAVLPDSPDYQQAKVILASPDASTAAKQIAAQVVAATSQKIVDAIAPVVTVPVVVQQPGLQPYSPTTPTIFVSSGMTKLEKAKAAGF